MFKIQNREAFKSACSKGGDPHNPIGEVVVAANAFQLSELSSPASGSKIENDTLVKGRYGLIY